MIKYGAAVAFSAPLLLGFDQTLQEALVILLSS
jgi:hypothetical protein